jgi:hypothetical protein
MWLPGAKISTQVDWVFAPHLHTLDWVPCPPHSMSMSMSNRIRKKERGRRKKEEETKTP